MGTTSVTVALEDIEFQQIHSPGPGGQNVNKVATGIHLRFDVRRSGLSEKHQQALLEYPDSRINAAGVVVIKANRYRSVQKDKDDAIARLNSLLEKATVQRKSRRATNPTTKHTQHQ